MQRGLIVRRENEKRLWGGSNHRGRHKDCSPPTTRSTQSSALAAIALKPSTTDTHEQTLSVCGTTIQLKWSHNHEGLNPLHLTSNNLAMPVFDIQAPYGFFSLPKLLGIPGGLLLSAGTLWMVRLKLQADGGLSDARVRGGDMAFVVLLFAVSTSGLLLYVATGTGPVPYLLTFHLATVLTLFLTLPYSKFVHGFYRLAALIRNLDGSP